MCPRRFPNLVMYHSFEVLLVHFVQNTPGNYVITNTNTLQITQMFQIFKEIQAYSCQRMEVLGRRNKNLYIPENLIKFSKSRFNFYLVILNVNKELERLVFRPLFSLSGVPSRTCCV